MQKKNHIVCLCDLTGRFSFTKINYIKNEYHYHINRMKADKYYNNLLQI